MKTAGFWWREVNNEVGSMAAKPFQPREPECRRFNSTPGHQITYAYRVSNDPQLDHAIPAPIPGIRVAAACDGFGRLSCTNGRHWPDGRSHARRCGGRGAIAECA